MVAASFAAVALVSAACGSTVQVRSSAATSAADGLGSGLRPTVASSAASSQNGGAAQDAGTSDPGANRSAPGGQAAHGGPGSTTSLSGKLSEEGDGPGVTATTINVAAVYDPNAQAENQALGAANQNPGDTRAAQQAVVDYVNAHGGVAHRKIKLVWYAADASLSRQQNDQAACAAYTQDAKVFVLGSGDSILNECTQRAHAIGLTEGIMGETSAVLKKYPTDVNITGFTTDRAEKATIDGLARQGYFSPTAKVGVVTWDNLDYRFGIAHGVQPALAAAGVRNAPVEYIRVPDAYGDLGATSAAVSSAVLKFHQQGIDHVVLLDGFAGTIGPGYLVLEWMTNAESQQWRPKYGLNSNSGFSTLAPNLPAKQMMGSLGVGWVPIADQQPSDQEAWLKTPQAQLCLKIMKDAGQPSNTNNQKTLQFFYCDFFFFLKHALDSVTGPLNVTTAMAAINAVGTSYPVLSTFGANITTSRHDGASLVRNMSFYSGCTCYRYTSAPYHAD